MKNNVVYETQRKVFNTGLTTNVSVLGTSDGNHESLYNKRYTSFSDTLSLNPSELEFGT